MKDLKNRWIELCKRINAKGDTVAYYTRIKTLYSEPPRFFHTLEGHIAHCLDEFDGSRHLADHPDEVEMALWLHDITYDTRRKDNEERSAQFGYELSKEMGLSDSFRRKAYNLILVTKHKMVPEKIDAKLVVDIDLSGFGLPEEKFDENNKNIRKEYSWVPEERFKAGRAAILQEFLPPNRPYIYCTDFFRRKYETKARRNLKRLLTQLRGVKASYY